jgi:hypothetical protein
LNSKLNFPDLYVLESQHFDEDNLIAYTFGFLVAVDKKNNLALAKYFHVAITKATVADTRFGEAFLNELTYTSIDTTHLFFSFN